LNLAPRDGLASRTFYSQILSFYGGVQPLRYFASEFLSVAPALYGSVLLGRGRSLRHLIMHLSKKTLLQMREF
jgi:hypothetical protein